jgi:phosphatidylglycerophosphate synthase
VHPVRAAALSGLAGQGALLAGLAGTVGLHWPGWTAGIACGAVTNGALAAALTQDRRPAIGAANVVTLVRATLVGGVAALVVDAFAARSHVATLIGLCVVALVLDGVDGRVARRTRTVSELGARFDMEVDAFLILLLSCYDARGFGAWVLLLGSARYLLLGASWCAGWLRAPVPPRYWRKVVAATAGIALAVTASDLVPRRTAVAALVVALLLLTESFGRDVWWLAARRARVQPSTAERRGARVPDPVRHRHGAVELPARDEVVGLELPGVQADRAHEVLPAGRLVAFE